MTVSRYPRDKDQLIKELDLAMRLRDINRSARMKDLLAPKWWETGVVMILFASGFGLLASLSQYASIRDEPLNAWMLFWFALMILTIVFSFEFMLVKIYNLRRSNDLLLRMIEDLRKDLTQLESKFEEKGGRGSAEEKKRPAGASAGEQA